MQEQPATQSHIDAIRRKNDEIRTQPYGEGKKHGIFVMTNGIERLNSLDKGMAIKSMIEFDSFSSELEPWEEKNQGRFLISLTSGETVEAAFKIEYFDEYYNETVTNPETHPKAKRVLTLALASEL